MWYYRICKKFTKHKGKKYPFYCIVEYYPKVGRYKFVKVKEGVKAVTLKGHDRVWSTNPEWPSGDSKKELIECLEMMLADAKRYKALIEKKPWVDPTITKENK